MSGRSTCYIAVAVDHGASFDHWLDAWRASKASRLAIKRGIIDICLSTGVSGLVISLIEFDAALPHLCRLASATETEVWLGLPDYDIMGKYDAAHSGAGEFPLEAALYAAAQAGAAGIKAGLRLAPQASWDEAVRVLEPTLGVASRLNLGVIIEPYFRAVDTAEQREAFLTSLRFADTVRFAKLDVHDPSVWGPSYESFSGWLARSEGLGFEEFYAGVGQSVRHGCTGTMVGAAVWGIDTRSILDLQSAELIAARIGRLKALFQRSSATG